MKNKFQHIKNVSLQIFSEEGNAFNTCVRALDVLNVKPNCLQDL